jgi:3',5'-cyclic AMP phosphodiesterase CpdA
MGLKKNTPSFLHISDTHILETRESEIRGVKPYSKLENLINSITQLEYKPKFAIITGDLTDNGSIQEYQLFKQLRDKLEENNIPILLTLGNHDNSINFRKVFPTETVNGPHYYVKEIDEFRIIALDSSVPGRIRGPDTGSFTGDQLSWLANLLEGEPNRPTIIALHHPINLASLDVWDMSFGVTQRNRFYQIIDGCNVLGILNGHLHHNQTVTVNGVLHCQAASSYAGLSYNDEEFWLWNTSGYNQIIYHNNVLYVKSIAMPCDGRLLAKGSIQQLLAA